MLPQTKKRTSAAVFPSKDLYFAKMLFCFSVIADSYRADLSGVSWLFSRFSLKTKCILFVFDLLYGVLRSGVDLQFQDDTVIFPAFWIKDKIYISFPGFVFPFHPIFVPCCKVNQVDDRR